MTKYTNLVGAGAIFCCAFLGCKQPKSDSSVSSSEESGTWSAECYLVAEGDDERSIQEVLSGKSVPMEQCPSPESAEQSSPDGSSLNLASPAQGVRAARVGSAVISFISEGGPAMFARLGEGGLSRFARIDGGSLLGGTRKLGAGRAQEKLRLLAAIHSRLDREVPLLDGFIKSILENSSPVFKSRLRNTNPEAFFAQRWKPLSAIVPDGELLAKVMQKLTIAGHGGREYSLAFQQRYLDAVDVAWPRLAGGKNAIYHKILSKFVITAEKSNKLPIGIRSNIPGTLAAKFPNYSELASGVLVLPAEHVGTKLEAEVSLAQVAKDLFMVHIKIDPLTSLSDDAGKLAFPKVLAEVKKIFGDTVIIGNYGSPRVTILVKPGDQSILQKIADFLQKKSR